MSEKCPCGSRRAFTVCCSPYLAGQKVAPTAEALMRSRYTAFCKSQTDYLIATHHPSTKQPDDREALQKTIRNTEWRNLIVLNCQKGKSRDKTGVVEFVAACQPRKLLLASTSAQTTNSKETLMQLHERSRFVKENGQWLYTEGDILPDYQPKRTELCWCGSGKKFKQCHEKSNLDSINDDKA
ncbi:MAG: hypothetical protein DCF25_17270 [Leptolyngbya foveolarum]|uniref:YchJ-like middle NTF2-like domain-containing protein n=1 Tax=Leptolyngbya foveolarum TaxID=47253 RepID=A0A2W4W0M3_9CYAN|nr:MAG: hypothetical protein DCF25_17270 [Leptolyngbya foveolarum]